jgi:hypothetical protein
LFFFPPGCAGLDALMMPNAVMFLRFSVFDMVLFFSADLI